METIKNAAEVLLGYSTTTTDPAQESGKEPGTGETEPGAGGVEPYDPGNKEENTEEAVPTSTTTEKPTATSGSAALPGEAASLGKPTSTAELEASPAPAETGAAPSSAAHTSQVAPATAGATADGVTPATATSASTGGTFLAYPIQSKPTVVDGVNSPKTVDAVTTAEPSGPRPTTPPKIGSVSTDTEPTTTKTSTTQAAAAPTTTSALPEPTKTETERASSTSSSSHAAAGTAENLSATDSPSGKKKLSTRLKEKLHIKKSSD
ncbi:hypothetical protein K461DRAFT_298502 [Myriangium duriaei CBS 260.36]|uniref:Uncharacterized protein n=1 Tax=Myriangium duriaei CBS 260.36 TaxID=1168546 RepID=A0A9P4MBS5_9PEZI|nr:hypothetical protein K461DRAFT_298502 [Myriangium duriaei CBS 260.36]